MADLSIIICDTLITGSEISIFSRFFPPLPQTVFRSSFHLPLKRRLKDLLKSFPVVRVYGSVKFFYPGIFHTFILCEFQITFRYLKLLFFHIIIKDNIIGDLFQHMIALVHKHDLIFHLLALCNVPAGYKIVWHCTPVCVNLKLKHCPDHVLICCNDPCLKFIRCFPSAADLRRILKHHVIFHMDQLRHAHFLHTEIRRSVSAHPAKFMVCDVNRQLISPFYRDQSYRKFIYNIFQIFALTLRLPELIFIIYFFLIKFCHPQLLLLQNPD